MDASELEMGRKRLTLFKVVDLFDSYSFDLKRKNGPSAADFDPWLLHGSNGVGKSTVMKLMYSLLTPTLGQGTKTYLGKIPFKNASVILEDRTKITAYRKDMIKGNYEYIVETIGSGTIKLRIEFNEEGKINKRSQDALEILSEKVKDLGFNVSLITDNREFFSNRAEKEEMSADHPSNRLSKLWDLNLGSKIINYTDNRVINLTMTLKQLILIVPSID